MESVFERPENIGGKGENAGNQNTINPLPKDKF